MLLSNVAAKAQLKNFEHALDLADLCIAVAMKNWKNSSVQKTIHYHTTFAVLQTLFDAATEVKGLKVGICSGIEVTVKTAEVAMLW